MDWNAIWEWPQGLVVFVIALVASYKLWLPPLNDLILKKLDQRFDRQMQDAEHAFEQKVRHVQSVIDRELDRARKLQDREFDALTQGWTILHNAYWRARDATNRGYTVHDLTQMGDKQLDEFIDSLTFQNWQKEELRRIEDIDEKQNAYVKAWRMSQYAECQRWRQKLLIFTDRRGIFLQPEIKQPFDELHTLIRDALTEHGLRIRDLDIKHHAFNEFVKSDRLRSEGEVLYEELENLIRKRIWSPVQQQ